MLLAPLHALSSLLLPGHAAVDLRHRRHQAQARLKTQHLSATGCPRGCRRRPGGHGVGRAQCTLEARRTRQSLGRRRRQTFQRPPQPRVLRRQPRLRRTLPRHAQSPARARHSRRPQTHKGERRRIATLRDQEPSYGRARRRLCRARARLQQRQGHGRRSQRVARAHQRSRRRRCHAPRSSRTQHCLHDSSTRQCVFFVLCPMSFSQLAMSRSTAQRPSDGGLREI